MQKPDQKVLEFYDLGVVYAISVDYRQTSSDTAETFLTLTFDEGKSLEITKRTFDVYFVLDMSWAWIACLRPELATLADEWYAYEEENSIELKEYERLKAKYEK